MVTGFDPSYFLKDSYCFDSCLGLVRGCLALALPQRLWVKPLAG